MITYDEYLIEGFTWVSKNEFNYLNRVIKRKISYLTFKRFDYSNETHIYYYNEILLSVLQDLGRSGLLREANSDSDYSNNNLAIKSETVGQHKVEYVASNDYKDLPQEKRDAIIDFKINRIIREQLGHTGLLYRGRYRSDK